MKFSSLTFMSFIIEPRNKTQVFSSKNQFFFIQEWGMEGINLQLSIKGFK